MNEVTYFQLAYSSYKCIDLQFKNACEMDWFNIFGG